MLRRFFARRGVPCLITSDNARTFELGETILKESIQAARHDPTVLREWSDREITWRHITPYAPWQGGLYERLIKSVKHSLHKTLGRSLLSFEELSTTVIEIEALLNTSLLTYVSNDINTSILHPIDFVQKDLQLSCPLAPILNEKEGPTYRPAEEEPTLQTRKQALQALDHRATLPNDFGTCGKPNISLLYAKSIFSTSDVRGDVCSSRQKDQSFYCVIRYNHAITGRWTLFMRL
ncbi:unnamed protein product [Haemonchus placei]|uniref:Integrase catalytic domain-containing protein n=1 Tax=Haemonchus placei TaxID=6290 RepID=A0A0N4X174_HAEPC|nr:unnamed protein product [Haemonchus placei]